MIREGSGEPLVLMHGILGSERIWRRIVPGLVADYEVIVPTALGHKGGPRAVGRPVSIEDVIDASERQLDELGIEKAHLVGNSMGGWMAIELARRGRGLSVCALSPAGFWKEDWKDRDRIFRLLSRAARDTRRGRALLPTLARSSRFRRWALRESAVYGDRVTREELIESSDDVIGCEIVDDLLKPGFQIAPLDPAPCPINLAWSEHDRLFPPGEFRPWAEERIPGAEFNVLGDVGHVPMFDDPGLVVRTIRETAGAAAGSVRSE